MTRGKAFWRSGDPFIWLTGGAVAAALLMVLGLVGLILWNGLGLFWPKDVVRLTMDDGSIMTAIIVQREAIPAKAGEYRLKLKVGNRDLYGAYFRWVEEARIAKREWPAEIGVIDRTEWGALIGVIDETREGGRTVGRGPRAGWVL